MKLKYWKRNLGKLLLIIVFIPNFLLLGTSALKTVKAREFSKSLLIKTVRKGIVSAIFLTIIIYLTHNDDSYSEIFKVVIYLLLLLFVCSILFSVLGYILITDFYRDIDAYPIKYKVFNEQSRYIEIDNLEFNKIDTFLNPNNQNYYVILKQNQENFAGQYNVEEDSLTMLDDLETQHIISLYYNSLPQYSYYKGGLLGHFVFNHLLKLLSIISLGIAWPFLVSMKLKYVASRTYINGEKQVFDGNGMQLFGKYILWLFLTVITLGIYSIWLKNNVRKWITKHTHFVVSETGESRFIGGVFEYYFLTIGIGILKIITLGILSFWAHCVLNRYLVNHTVIDGVKLRFDGTAMQYFGKRVLWLFLTVVTLGIYSLWLFLRSKKWTIKHTVFNNDADKKIIRGLSSIDSSK